jgi:hypothetical protein
VPLRCALVPPRPPFAPRQRLSPGNTLPLRCHLTFQPSFAAGGARTAFGGRRFDPLGIRDRGDLSDGGPRRWFVGGSALRVCAAAAPGPVGLEGPPPEGSRALRLDARLHKPTGLSRAAEPPTPAGGATREHWPSGKSPQRRGTLLRPDSRLTAARGNPPDRPVSAGNRIQLAGPTGYAGFVSRDPGGILTAAPGAGASAARKNPALYFHTVSHR